MDNKEEEIKNLITQLASAIQNSLSNSTPIKEIMESLRQKGYGTEMLLMLSVGLSHIGNQENKGLKNLYYQFTPGDLDFLKSIKIKPEE